MTYKLHKATSSGSLLLGLFPAIEGTMDQHFSKDNQYATYEMHFDC